MSEAKQAMRSEMRQSLATLTDAERRGAQARLGEALWASSGPLRAAFAPGGVLMAFMPLPDEIDPTLAMQRWLGKGGRLAVPVSGWQDRTMEAHEVTSLEEDSFDVTRHGIREPRHAAAIAAERISVVLVPGLAFDPSGCRLGRGAGFYDRDLPRVSAACTVIGVCHRSQVVSEVPHGPLDRPVGHVVAV